MHRRGRLLLRPMHRRPVRVSQRRRGVQWPRTMLRQRVVSCEPMLRPDGRCVHERQRLLSDDRELHAGRVLRSADASMRRQRLRQARRILRRRLQHDSLAPAVLWFRDRLHLVRRAVDRSDAHAPVLHQPVPGVRRHRGIVQIPRMLPARDELRSDDEGLRAAVIHRSSTRRPSSVIRQPMPRRRSSAP